MLTYFHPEQLKHHPQSYLSRGRMRTPQEVPERARGCCAPRARWASRCASPPTTAPRRSRPCTA
jgi:hypothetical protein